MFLSRRHTYRDQLRPHPEQSVAVRDQGLVLVSCQRNLQCQVIVSLLQTMSWFSKHNIHSIEFGYAFKVRLFVRNQPWVLIISRKFVVAPCECNRHQTELQLTQPEGTVLPVEQGGISNYICF